MRAAIFGANGGIGRALCQELLNNSAIQIVYAIARSETHADHDARIVPVQVDFTDDKLLARAADQIGQVGMLDLVIVASGVLSDGETIRPEKTYRDQSIDAFEQVFAANTFGPAMVAKHFLPMLRRQSPSKFAVLSARVGSITDNRLGGWHAYRASKAALNMLVKNYALELARRNDQAVCVSLHPGTVATRLSAPFTSGGNRELFKPELAARQLLDVLSKLDAASSGKHFDWGGLEIPA
ncbi:MAG: SDR family NAD(P)-dependent oxidoreductase [Hyphomonadaceae bacterium]